MRGRARRFAAAAAIVVLSAVVAASAGAASARRDAQPARLLVALSETNGAVVWRAKARGDNRGSLDARLVTHGLVLAEESRCGSAGRADQPGDAALVAFDARSGRERWRAPDVGLTVGRFGRIDPPGPGIDTIPVSSVGDERPSLLDVRTGQTRGPLAGVPVAASAELLIVAALDSFRASASDRGRVTALDRRTGAPVWTANLSAALFSVTADATGVAFAAGPIEDPGTALGKAGGIGGLDPGDGHLRWATPPSPLYGVDVAAGRVVFQTSQQLQALDLATGQLAWGVPVDGQLDPGGTNHDTLVVVGDGTALAARAVPNAVVAFAAGSGTLRWRHDLPGHLLNPDISVDRVIAVGTHERILAYDTTHGRRLWSRVTPRSATGIVAGGGRVYVSGGCPITAD